MSPTPGLLTPGSLRGTQQLDRSLVRGVAWTGGAQWASQLLTWASTLLVARLLSPEDYGLVGMAAIYLGLITLVGEFGLGAAVISLRQLTADQIAQLHGLSVLFGAGGLAASCIAAVPLGRFFDAPQLPAVVIAMSVALPLAGLKTVPFSLLQRDMQFRALALIETARAVLLAAGMVTFALLGWRYWTLVVGAILSVAFSTAGVLWLRRQRLAWPRIASLDHVITFSRRLLTARLAWYAYSNADFLIAGRILGKAALGFYSVGWTLASIPIEKLASLVNQVTPAVFSAVQTDRAALRRYLLRITEGLALITFPASIGLALVAPDFVPVVLGEHWRGSIVPLQLLALSTGFRAVTPLLSQVLTVLGETRLIMRYSMLWVAVLPASFYLLGSRWGTAGLALTWVVIFPLLAVPAYRLVLRRIELSGWEYLRATWPAASSSAVMAAGVLLARWIVGDALSLPLRLAMQVAVGAALYTAACLILHGRRVAAFTQVVRGVRAGAPAGEAPAS